nr:MAG TPA: Protein of unknown function (DUF2794) [Bacteriophage sp.]
MQILSYYTICNNAGHSWRDYSFRHSLCVTILFDLLIPNSYLGIVI